MRIGQDIEKKINQNLIFQDTFHLLFALFVTTGECIITGPAIKHMVPFSLCICDEVVEWF